MTFEDSPKLEDYEEGLPIRSPEKKKRRKIVIRSLIGVLIVVITGFGLTQIQDSENFARLAGEGSIAGHVNDHHGNPYPADVAISGTKISTTANEEGLFELEHVPIGDYSIIFLNDSYGWEQKASVQSGQNTDMGTITIPDIEVEPLDIQ